MTNRVDNRVFDLSGRTALVTGGSRGLGRSMSLAFAAAGADVVVTSRKIDSCREVVAEIESMGRQGLAHACHVGHWDDVDRLIDAAYERFGKVDVLVNNAGMSPLYPSLSEVSEALFDKVIGVNLKGPFRLAAVIGQRMAEGNGGSIINVTSTAAIHPSANAEPYGAAKAGLNSLTESLAHAYGPRVRVNAIMPGPFLTDISKAWDLEAFNKRAQTSIALRRGGEPDEIVGAALYLASDASSYTTGAVLRIDGGSR
jgi:NAD(P)-dependent dehydrogenase (short-subunit alcohol dehydrogenase family)